MKSANRLKDLEQFGIKPLTGEADALGFRILCDLDEQGVKIFRECFGLCGGPPPKDGIPPTGFNDAWNSGSIASVMLTSHDIVPLAAIGFYLQGYNVVITKNKDNYEAVFALEQEDVLELNNDCSGYKLNGHKWPVVATVRRIIRQRKSDSRVVGTRNVHQMSGRVE